MEKNVKEKIQNLSDTHSEMLSISDILHYVISPSFAQKNLNNQEYEMFLSIFNDIEEMKQERNTSLNDYYEKEFFVADKFESKGIPFSNISPLKNENVQGFLNRRMDFYDGVMACISDYDQFLAGLFRGRQFTNYLQIRAYSAALFAQLLKIKIQKDKLFFSTMKTYFVDRAIAAARVGFLMGEEDKFEYIEYYMQHLNKLQNYYNENEMPELSEKNTVAIYLYDIGMGNNSNLSATIIGWFNILPIQEYISGLKKGNECNARYKWHEDSSIKPTIRDMFARFRKYINKNNNEYFELIFPAGATQGIKVIASISKICDLKPEVLTVEEMEELLIVFVDGYSLVFGIGGQLNNLTEQFMLSFPSLIKNNTNAGRILTFVKMQAINPDFIVDDEEKILQLDRYSNMLASISNVRTEIKMIEIEKKLLNDPRAGQTPDTPLFFTNERELEGYFEKLLNKMGAKMYWSKGSKAYSNTISYPIYKYEGTICGIKAGELYCCVNGHMNYKGVPEGFMREPEKKVAETGGIRFCDKCGEKLLPDSIFCHSCGAKVR